MALPELPSSKLDQRIDVLEDEIKTTHPKSPQLQTLVRIKDGVRKTEDKFTNVIFALTMGELLIGLLAVSTTIPDKNLENEIVIVAGTLATFMGTAIAGVVSREVVRQRMISSELSKLDQRR